MANLFLEHSTISLLFQNFSFFYFLPHYKILSQLEQIGK